jgi:CTP-dependent riboflavin kinase
LLEKTKATEILPAEGFCTGQCFKASLMDNFMCAVIIPEIGDYPKDVVEIISAENLRKKLNLKDTDNLTVKVYL